MAATPLPPPLAWLRAQSCAVFGVPRPRARDRRLVWSSDAAFKRLLARGQPVLLALLVPG